MLLLSHEGRGEGDGRGAGGGAGQRGVEWRGLEADPGKLPGCWGPAWPACISLPLPELVHRTLTIHYPAWLMHQSGKFDFFAKKAGRDGGRRGASERKGAAGAALDLACRRLLPWPDSPGRRLAVEGLGPVPGGWRGRWAEVRTFRSPCPPPPASPSALRWRGLHYLCSRPHL